MNLINCTVTKILSKPYYKYDKWWVIVEYDCYGRKSEKSLCFKNKEQSEKLKVGTVFLE